MQRKLLEITNVDFDATYYLLIIYSAFVKYLRKKWEYAEVVSSASAINRLKKNTYDYVRSDILFNIICELGVPRKLARLLKMCLNNTYAGVRVGKKLSDMFPINNSLKK
jgi:hypothetical protein